MLPSSRLGVAAITASLATGVTSAVIDLPIITYNGYPMIELQAGTPASTYRLMFDTGSASTWIVDKECAENCTNGSGFDRRPGYDIDASSTANNTGQIADIQYLGGRVAGVTVVDDFKADNVTWRQPFIAANESNWVAQPNHGFMGLAFGSIADAGATPVFEQLMAAGLMDEPRFGIYFDQSGEDSPEGGFGTGVVTLGGSREEEYVEGEMQVVDLTQGGPGYDVWRSVLHTTTGSRIGPNGSVIETQVNFGGGTIVFDTGASSIGLDDNQIEAAYESIGWNWTAVLTGKHVPLCTEFNNTWSFTLEVGFYGATKNVTVTGDMIALPGFANRDDACWPPFDSSGGEGFSLIGKRLLQRFYTVWDYGSFPSENQFIEPKLAFGKLKPKKTCGKHA